MSLRYCPMNVAIHAGSFAILIAAVSDGDRMIPGFLPHNGFSSFGNGARNGANVICAEEVRRTFYDRDPRGTTKNGRRKDDRESGDLGHR